MSDKGTSLIPANVFAGLPVTVGDSASYSQLNTAKSGFLPRLQLCSKGKFVDSRQVGPGEYAIITGDKARSLGDKIDLMIFARRHKAIDTTDRSSIMVSYVYGSDVFEDIVSRAGDAAYECQYGASYLVGERSSGQLLELFCGTSSMRREAELMWSFAPLTEEQIAEYRSNGLALKDVQPGVPRPFTLTSENVQRKKYSYFVPVIAPCSVPFTQEQLPSIEQLTEEINKFAQPAKEEMEALAQKTSRGKRAR